MRWLLAFFRRLFMHQPPPVWTPTPLVTRYGTVIHRGGQQEIDGLQRLGLSLTRHTFAPGEDASTPTYRAAFNAKLLALDAVGIEPLIVVWDFRDAEHAVQVMADLTRFYPNRLWQVGNEYDAQPFRTWCNTGGQYAALMQRIVAACPSTRFVGMGLATADSSTVTPDRERRQAFVRDYQAAQGPTLIAWCLHVYGLPMAATLRTQVTDFQQALQGATPLWVTECGADRATIEHAYGPQSDSEVDRLQALCASDILATAPGLGVERAYWYDFWNEDDYGFGLVRDNDAPRPSWDVLHLAA